MSNQKAVAGCVPIFGNLCQIITISLIFASMSTFSHGQTFFQSSGAYRWSDQSNWNPTSVPNAIGASATFNVSGGTLILGNDASVTLGTLNVSNTVSGSSFQLNVFTPNPSPLIFDVSSGNAAINLTGSVAGTNSVAVSSTLNDNLVVTNTASMGLTLQGVVSGTGGITKLGAGNLTLNASNSYTGSTVVSAGTLTLGHASNTLSDSGVVTINGGTLDLGSNSDTVGAVTISSGSLSGSGTLTGSSYSLQGGSVAAKLGAGDISVSGGTTTLVSAGRLTSSSSLSISGGQLNLGGNETVASFTQTGGSLGGTGALTSTGAVSISGGSLGLNIISTSDGLTKTTSGSLTLTGSSSFAGTSVVSAGTLVVNGNITGGALAVSSGATLAGSGVIANTTTFQSGSFHNPGNSPGLQTFASGVSYAESSTFTWELASNTDLLSNRGTLIGYDGVNVTGGNLSITSGAIGNISLIGSTSVPTVFWSTDRSWLVFDNSGSGTTTGIFNLGTVTGGSFSPAFGTFAWRIDNKDLFLDFVAVPEPTSMAMVAVGACIIVGSYRRRKIRTLMDGRESL